MLSLLFSITLGWTGPRLVSVPTFCNGSLTDSGLPSSFFDSTHTPDQRARYVQVIGPPGSGKSSAIRGAAAKGWVVLSTDGFRIERLKELKSRNQKVWVERGGAWVLEEPNPTDLHHLFYAKEKPEGPNMLDFGFTAMAQALESNFAAGKSVIDDQVHGNLGRARSIHLARVHGFSVEGVFFLSPTPDFNVANVGLRVASGGFGVNESAIRALHASNQFTLGLTYVDPSRHHTILPNPPATPPLRDLFERFADLNALIGNIPLAGKVAFTRDEHLAVLKLLEEHVYNRVEFVQVRNYALP